MVNGERQLFVMPPYSRIVRITLTGDASIESATFDDSIDVAKDGESYLLRSESRESIAQAVAHLREVAGISVRVHADPRRY